MEASFKSDIGKVRKVNEDSGGIFFNRHDQMLALIADGMGGHKAGDVASQLVANHLKELWEQTDQFLSEDEVSSWLDDAIQKTNKHVLTHAQNEENCLGMGTTVVAAAFINRFVVVAHVGDSRLYHITNEQISQITEDHSFVQELLKNGEITTEEAEAHPKRNVLMRAVGTEEDITVDINSFYFEENSYILICSDGLSNKLSTDDMYDIILSNESLQNKIDQLIDLANQRGGEDNISVILVKCSRDKAGETT